MTRKTNIIIGILFLVALLLAGGIGIVIGFFTGKASLTDDTSTTNTSRAAQTGGPCSKDKLQAAETKAREQLRLAAASRSQTLISTSQLREHIRKGTTGLRILDVTYNTVEGRTDAYRLLYQKSHIPNSIYYDAWQCVNRTDLIPNNIPDKDCFEDYVKRLGINSDTRVVVYDRIGSLPAYKNKRHSKPSFRALWLFRLHGHRNISILDGGFQKWVEDSYEVTAEIPQIQKSTDFKVNFDDSLIRNYEEMVDIVKNKKAQIIDARTVTSATVIDPESDGGYMPCAKFLPSASIFQKDGTVRPNHHLLQLVTIAGIDLEKPIVSTCLTGMSATIVAGTLLILGKEVPVYYGSWTEWRQRASEEMKIRIKP